MRKAVGIITLIFLISLNAAALEFPFLGKVKAGDINLRAGPNTTYESLDKLKKGTEVLVIAERFSWYKIALPKDTVCFISRKYVKRSGVKEGVVTADRVNLRAKPSEAATILGQANKDYTVKIVETYPGWYGISAPDDLVSGWVHKKFIDYYSQVKKEEQEIAQEPLSISEPIVITEEVAKQAETTDDIVKRPLEVKIKPEPTASGKIHPMGIFFRRRGTHKLIIDGKAAYYLKGDKEILNRFAGYKVNIFGQIEDNPNQRVPLIKVEKVEIVE